MKNIGVFTSVYFNNIGNAFIDFGAIATIEAALPTGAQLIRLSQYPNFASAMAKGMMLKENKLFHALWVKGKKVFSNLHDRSYKLIDSKAVFNVAEIARLDFLVVPGCVLTVPFFSLYFDLLMRIKSKGTKIVFLGASGNYYSENEINSVVEFLKRLEPAALMFRDPKAFELYKHLSHTSYNGIDNAFFVNRLKLPKVDTHMDPFVVLNFDDPRNFHLNEEFSKKFKNIIKTNHKPFDLKYAKSYIDKGFMVSDTPLDYLFLYSNASEVHSDRVHACIPTLSYGNKCKIYSDSPRVQLFTNVGLSSVISEQVTDLNPILLKEKQDSQIEILNSIIAK
ncbi:polysaccharide pyruvyl transferase family protein [Sphingobacterium multivorum]|uniref:polysaccharide pyruvyl transferase family protein n=1 Tax=Sphingobacterium multivorum TaxID=28454 RepID=UPI003DA2B695